MDRRYGERATFKSHPDVRLTTVRLAAATLEDGMERIRLVDVGARNGVDERWRFCANIEVLAFGRTARNAIG